MTNSTGEIAGLIVQGRGSKRSMVAGVAGRQVFGMVGSIAGHAAAERRAKNGQTGPLAVGQTGYLAVLPGSLTLFATERGVVRKPHPSDKVLATAPASATQSARVTRGRTSGALEIGFDDGTSWAFDVARTDYAKAERVARAIEPAGVDPDPTLPTATGPVPVRDQTWWSRLSRGKRIALIVGAVVAVLTVLSLLGVGDEEEPAADRGTSGPAAEDDAVEPATVPAGFRVVDSPSDGFSIAIPDRWEEIDPSSEDLEAALDLLREDNPNLEATIDQAERGFSQNGVFFALDLANPAAFKPTMIIAKVPGAPGDVADAASVFEDQLESAGAEEVTSDVVNVPAGDALRVEGVVTLATPDSGSASIDNVLYVIVAEGSTWVFNLATGDLSADRATFDQIIETFRVNGT